MKRLFGVVRIAVRSLQMITWGSYGAAAFIYIMSVEAIGARGLNRHVALDAAGRAIRKTVERLGATFIKLGQVASTRPDLVPSEIIAHLVRLQEEVPPFPYEQVRRIVEEDFGAPLERWFSEFERRPLAAASVAQVHRARLAEGGEAVAVKVRRPTIAAWAQLDESIALGIAHLLQLFPTLHLLSPVHAVRQFCAAVNKQLDFRIEAANNLRFRENFKSEPEVVFPRLVRRLCSERVLTMDLLEGVRDTELAAAGIDPRQVAALGIKVFCKMAFIDGFVHADLHPGNIRFLRGGRIALFDLGLTAELSHEDRLMFAQTMYYMANGMGRELARHMFELCRRLGPIDYGAYEAEMIEYLRRFTNRPLGEIEMASAIGSFFDIFRRYRMRLDGRFTVLNISFVVVEGLGKKLDPTLDVTAQARPFLEAAVIEALAAAPGIGGR
ncbi:MAG TPA: AarF/UbiB family protein [Candidatus Binataceae bacterium]|nr:AarF/UbiB family protein [Candidatus Binataceae bacterium]